MMRIIVAVLVLGISGAAMAQRKPCEELKSEIEAKIKKNGVENFTLDIVEADKAEAGKEGRVVGSCDGGTKRIVYKRG